MVVTCPACGTRFELDENLIIRKESARVRCSRCQHTFSVAPPVPPAEPMAPPAPPVPTPGEVPGAPLSAFEPVPAPASPSEAPAPVLPPSGPETAPPRAASPPPEAPLAPTAPPRRWPWALALVTLLLVGGTGAAGWLYGDWRAGLFPKPAPTPAGAPMPVKPPPPPLTSAELQDLLVELGEARFGRLENPKGGKLLVLTGEVVNQGPIPRGPVRLKAALLDGRHREVAQRLAYAGSTFSDQDLATLPPGEIDRWLNTIGGKGGTSVLAPQARQPFTVIFFGVPADLAEGGYGFTLAVVEAPPAAKP